MSDLKKSNIQLSCNKLNRYYGNVFTNKLIHHFKLQCSAIPAGAWLLQIDLGIQVITSTIVIGAFENNASKNENEFLIIICEETYLGSVSISTVDNPLNKNAQSLYCFHYPPNNSIISR